MFADDPRRDARIIADLLQDSAVRGVFRALVRGRPAEASARLVAELGSSAARLDLGDPAFQEWLLEALEYRISPPDEEDAGLTRLGASTLPFLLEQAA